MKGLTYCTEFTENIESGIRIPYNTACGLFSLQYYDSFVVQLYKYYLKIHRETHKR